MSDLNSIFPTKIVRFELRGRIDTVTSRWLHKQINSYSSYGGQQLFTKRWSLLCRWSAKQREL